MRIAAIAAGAVALLAALTAAAQGPIAYPAAGQDAARQTKDDAECRARARQSGGYDPAAAGSSADDAAARALGAAGGLGAGGVPGGVERTYSERAAQIGAAAAAERRQGAAGEHPAGAEYQRAYARCMEERSYTLK
jgi:hypothetical protein